MNSVENTDNLVLNKDKNVPLAHRLRPATFEDVFGQDHLLKSNGIISNLLNGSLSISLLFWGPPGSGKTSIARLFSKSRDYHFVQISAIFSGVADLKKIFTDAARRKEIGITTLLFIDEIHRMPRYIEEILYPAMEDFTLDIIIGGEGSSRSIKIDLPPFTLVGATTRAGDLSAPLRDRFGIISKLKFYTTEELTEIIKRTSHQ